MKPSRPYILKALYDWLLDSDLTPHLLVDATQEGVTVPTQFVEDGQIVMNITPSAVRDFYMDEQAVSFNARFSGQPMDVYIPVRAVLAIYARENGQGMGFGGEPGVEVYMQDQVAERKQPERDEVEANKEKPKRPSLKVVK
ncbi:ClpXP protease specificity-enhancing factor [Neptuniibacter sp. 1_MG-2023]|uniref:ClpXP protease specificity-enhancing factor n=1 Tax=Neptuniibacter sp. 1_MG-2023 TaxID=3062662 RepID=UPI0026E1A336|nr:ClpXP protease specificity-enhancing factor [Neptuniibacter sp. 1_MG-2023]MDO6592957.1 ClpXP protease specificity-enhancing factor [Neptuniibacter sp. 1_MG-2023]